jgi:hypothetical protein
MAENLESLKRYVGASETANDVVTASAMGKIAATLGVENPACVIRAHSASPERPQRMVARLCFGQSTQKGDLP